MLNHTFSYPGAVRWNSVSLTFVCMNPYDLIDAKGKPQAAGLDTADMLWQMIQNSGYYPPSVPSDGTIQGEHKIGRFQSQFSLDKGWTTISTPEKASTISNAFGDGLHDEPDYLHVDRVVNFPKKVVIQQISSAAIEVLREETDFGDGGAPLYSVEIGRKTKPPTVTEHWELHSPVIKSINFGELSYDSDELVEYTMEIAYDYAFYNREQLGKEPLLNSLIADNYSSYPEDYSVTEPGEDLSDYVSTPPPPGVMKDKHGNPIGSNPIPYLSPEDLESITGKPYTGDVS